MGDEAESIDEVVDEPDEDVATSEEDSEETKPKEDTLPQVTQEQLDSAFVKQKLRLNKRNDATQGELQQTTDALALAQEENKILRLYADQQKLSTASPNVDEFEAGAEDPEFIRKKAEHETRLRDEEIARQISVRDEANANANAVNANAVALEQAQDKHFQRARELNKADYSDKENAAIDIFGVDAVNAIIQMFPEDSQSVLYYLGTNTDEARRIQAISKNNAGLAIAEIGAIREKHLKVSSKPSSVAPAPDEQIQGSASSKTQRGPPGATYS